jgi:hypothetical protein
MPTTIHIIDKNLPIYATGDQTISGVKSFASRPTINGIGVLLSGEAAQVDLSSTVQTTGDQTISGVKSFVSRPIVNSLPVLLSGDSLTGVQWTEITFTGENVVYTTGDQTISGVKSFVSRPTVNGTGVLLSGEAAQVDLSSTVQTTGDQTISGVKSFVSRPTVNGTGVLLSGEAAQVDLSSTVQTTGDQIIEGVKTFTQDINISGNYNFDITNTGEVSEGQMSWNSDYSTIQLGMDNNVVQPIGFKSFYRVKAAENIRKGKVIMALGGVGNSEYILAREAQNIGTSGQLIMGLSTEEILANNYGDVVAFGAVRGINTNSIPVDSILYYDPLSTGELTHIKPEPPLPTVIVGLNTVSNNNGIVFVRVTAGSELGGTDSNVKISNLQNKDVLTYDASNNLWTNQELQNYSLINFFHTTLSPADNTRYWIGQTVDLTASTAVDTDGRSFSLPLSGTAVEMSVTHYVGSNNANALATELSSFWFANLTTNTSGQMLTGVSSNLRSSRYTALIDPPVYINDGDQVSVAFVSANWSASTNPSAIRNSILVKIRN